MKQREAGGSAPLHAASSARTVLQWFGLFGEGRKNVKNVTESLELIALTLPMASR